MTKKAFDKVLHYYFSDDFTGLNDTYGNPTRVEEAWVFITHVDREEVPENHQSRVKRRWGYIPIVNEVVITIVNLFVALVYVSVEQSTPSLGWRCLWKFLAILARYLCWVVLDVVPGIPTPPKSPLVPYIAIYFRGNKNHPTFYHLHPDQVLLAPWNSTLSKMKPLRTNRILSM
jgi:hypothetical protein